MRSDWLDLGSSGEPPKLVRLDAVVAFSLFKDDIGVPYLAVELVGGQRLIADAEMLERLRAAVLAQTARQRRSEERVAHD